MWHLNDEEARRVSVHTQEMVVKRDQSPLLPNKKTLILLFFVLFTLKSPHKAKSEGGK